eukprot:c16341_g1_i1.p2 GENE.c16341_g1_i1~~c16341_g1_i1.p2  ORF type:complete len:385 (+),score=105.99 c16341_g1_i1:146-1300(+)
MDAGLAPVEALQLGALLSDSIVALGLLGDISRDILEQREELAQATGEETSQILLEQKALEARYEELVEMCAQLKAMANKTKYREAQEELARISFQLRQATELLCRNLKENPNVADNLLKIQSERRNLVNLLRETQTELGRQQFRLLLVSVREERNKEETLRKTIDRERQASAEAKRLADKLAEVEAEKADAVHELNIVIAKKKTALQKAKKEASESYHFAVKRYTALKYSRRRQHEEKERGVRAELTAIRRRTEIEQRCSDRIRDFLARSEADLQGQVGQWNDRYFADIEAKRREVDALKIKRSQLATKVDQLSSQYEAMRAVVEKDTMVVKQREAALLFGIKMGEATARLQHLWRGHRARQGLIAAQNRGRRRKKGAAASKKK